MERDEKQLERWAERELSRLPELQAPATLLHRVMLEVHARERKPWWKRAWTEWPRQAQLLSVAVLTAVAVVFVLGGTDLAVSADSSPLWARLKGYTDGWRAAWGAAHSLGRAGGLVLKSLGQQYLLIAVALVVMAYGMSVGLFTACYRLANQRG